MLIMRDVVGMKCRQIGPVFAVQLLEEIEVDQGLQTDLFPFSVRPQARAHEEAGNSGKRSESQAEHLELDQLGYLRGLLLASQRRVCARGSEIQLLNRTQLLRPSLLARRKSAGDPKALHVAARGPAHDRSVDADRFAGIGGEFPDSRTGDCFRGLLQKPNAVLFLRRPV